MARRVLALIGAVAVTGLAVAYLSVPSLPPRYAPWAPLDVKQKPLAGITTLKLAHVRRSFPYCRAALETAEWRYTFLQRLSAPGGGCAVEDAIRVDASNLQFSSGFSATCPLSVALAMTIQHVVQPAARVHLKSEVARLDHLGTFACRRVRGGKRPEGRLSEHAAANAIDITGFVLTDGRTISVAKSWGNSDDKKNDEALFLRAVRDGACGFFQGVLSPDYNETHRSHFHFDMGRWHICR